MSLQGTERTRIEVLVDAPLVPELVSLLEKHGIHGHTVMPTLSGQGVSGSWSDDLITSAQHKVALLTVAEPARAEGFIDDLRPLLDSYGLLVMISPVNVLRPEKFP
jgi:PII-like signaling protein